MIKVANTSSAPPAPKAMPAPAPKRKVPPKKKRAPPKKKRAPRKRRGRGKSSMHITVQSAGIRAGNFSKITVNGKLRNVQKNKSGNTRGINMVVINPNSKKVILEKAFDTYKTS